jgi:hypothetical protein
MRGNKATPKRPPTITFKSDPASFEALLRLEAAAGPGLLRPRSGIIRGAIISAAARLDGKVPR